MSCVVFVSVALQVFSGISSEPLYHRKQEYMQAARMGNLKPVSARLH